MVDGREIAIAASGWAAWTAREIITRLLDRRLARIGPIGLIEGRSRIVCDTDSKSGGTFAVDYFPSMSNFPQYADCRRFRLILDSQFFNDTDTQVVFTKFDLELWGVEGLRMQHSGAHPSILAEGAATRQSSGALPVAPHSTARVLLEIFVGSSFSGVDENIREYLGEAVVLLKVQSIDGKGAAYRICTHSFAGMHSVVWPLKSKYPIFNVKSLNVGGRRAGRTPQPRTVPSDN